VPQGISKDSIAGRINTGDAVTSKKEAAQKATSETINPNFRVVIILILWIPYLDFSVRRAGIPSISVNNSSDAPSIPVRIQRY
jgi:hypothetical protein